MKLDLFDSIPIDAANQLDQTTAKFQGVRDGLPELVKNAKDQYARLGVDDKDDRQVVVIVSDDGRKLGVLDFAGAKIDDFEGWVTWSSRTAGRGELSDDIEAGYGNGGKSFMVRGAVRYGYMVSSSGGRVTKMGFENDTEDRRYKPGWGTDERGKPIRNIVDRNPLKTLNEELAALGVSFDDLPDGAQRVFGEREAFTLVVLDGVKDWQGIRSASRTQRIRDLPDELSGHPQAALTIESGNVWVTRGARLLREEPLSVATLAPYVGFEEPRVIPVPDTLVDPETGEEVATGPHKRFLEIRTSARNLRQSDRTKPLNVIRVRNSRNVVANFSVANLAPFAASAFIYGTLKVPALKGENLAGSDRQSLADRPLPRALAAWCTEQIEEVAKEIQKAQASSESDADRTRTNQALARLRELMRKFLEPRTPENGRDGDGKKGPKEPRPEREYGSIVHEIEVEDGRERVKLAVGTTVPLIVRCFEHRDGKKLPVRNARVQMRAGAIVTQSGRSSVTGLETGTTTVFFENEDGSVTSNSIEVEVVEIAAMTITPPDRLLKQGEKHALAVTAVDATGAAVPNLLLDAGVDETEMGSIGRSGTFTAGRLAGEATVRIRHGASPSDTVAVMIGISDERVEPKGEGGGPDIPHLLMCGDMAPDTEELPEEQRTIPPSETYPTIIEFEPQFENVVWLNQGSVESMKVRTSRGPKPLKIGSPTFVRFLSLKAFEVLKHLKVQETIGDNKVTSTEFLRELATAELDVGAFMDAAEVIVKGLAEERAGEEDDDE